MRISVAEAGERLLELIKRAKSGEDVFITENDLEFARLEPVGVLGADAERNDSFIEDPAERDRFIEDIQQRVRLKNLPVGTDAARSHDFLYDDYGLPR